ncbi:MAG: DUF4476 domain-containing protein [Bacteroidota bacterium]|nr:DUF4476 domain-containing protein [Bacteroidota bacterium]
MKKLHLSLMFSLFVLTASSQKVYFIYIQTEAEQPFFVKMNEKVSSSTASGYIILSKLVDSTYSFSVGFPQGKWPEQNFAVMVSKKDHGYLLKNFGEKGWGLFDLQTLAIQMSVSGKASVEDNPKGETGDVSAFTEILSKAADDPSLKEKPVVAKVEEKKVEVVALKEPVKKELTAVAEEPKAEEIKTVVAVPEIKKELTAVAEVPKVEVKEIVVTKPAEAIESAVVKTEPPKAEIKEAVINKPAEKAEELIVKKEEIKGEVMPAIKTVEIVEPTIVKKDSSMVKEESKAMSKEMVAVKLVEEPMVKKEEVKESVVAKPAETVDPAGVKIDLSVVAEEPKVAAQNTAAELYKASQVKKWSESSTTEGFGLVYIDDYENGIKDTIRLVIPNPKPAVTLVKEEPKDEKLFIKTSDLPARDDVSGENKAIVEKPIEPVVEKVVAKNNCKDVATGDDFVKLRKRMAATETDDDMIAEAKKYYKLKCFSTWQLKNLAVLFLTDEGKYKFLDASYSFVTDTQTFPTLQAELKDEYYISRFKAMLRN